MKFSMRQLIWNFFFRMAVGLGLIVTVNLICSMAEIPLWVGVNPVTAAATGFLGVPGVFLLYGITASSEDGAGDRRTSQNAGSAGRGISLRLCEECLSGPAPSGFQEAASEEKTKTGIKVPRFRK